MKKITSKILSAYRLEIFQLTQQVKQLALKSAYTDALIKGTPGEVYRKCGYKNCKCAKDPSMRHGPYKVIQVYKDGKQRQIALRKDQEDIWEKAKHYQQQIQYLSQLKKTCKELVYAAEKMIEKRIEECPK